MKPATVSVNCEGFYPCEYEFRCKSDFIILSVGMSYLLLSLSKDIYPYSKTDLYSSFEEHGITEGSNILYSYCQLFSALYIDNRNIIFH